MLWILILLAAQLPLYFLAATDRFTGGVMYFPALFGIWTATLTCFAFVNVLAFVRMRQLRMWTSNNSATTTMTQSHTKSEDIVVIVKRIERTAVLLASESIILVLLLNYTLPGLSRSVYSNPDPNVYVYDVIYRVSVTWWLLLLITAFSFIFPKLRSKTRISSKHVSDVRPQTSPLQSMAKYSIRVANPAVGANE
jgi:hypothetical protein